jgi:hypothetical protein
MRKFLATNKQTKDGSFLSVRFFLRPYDFLGPMLWKKIGRMQKKDPCERSFSAFWQPRYFLIFWKKRSSVLQRWRCSC